MLDFLLVLGQIPGTNFQITFSEMLVLVALVGVIYVVRKEHFLVNGISWMPKYIKLYTGSQKSNQLSLKFREAPISRKNLDQLARLFVHQSD